ncbi:MAG: extracellular solute-binding protein [Treponema sp.]|nr:extracellular solute-binding protein [Treponema sp.]
MKRIIVLLIAVLMVLSVFSGCKKSDEAKIVYWSMWNEAEPQGQAIARAAEAFTRETGIKIEINFNGRDIRMTLQPALDAGETIDIFDEDVDRVNSAWANYLLPLDQYIARTYSTTNGQPFNTVVNSAMMNIVRQLGGGSVKTIPYQPFVFTVMYNKDLFSRAGITTLPKTWNEFLDVCARLKAIDIHGITVDDAYMAALAGYCFSRIVGLEATMRMSANNDFSGPQVLRFGQIWENMARNGYVHPNAASNVWPAGQVNEFAQGRAAMYLNGTWLPNEIKGNAPNFNWGSFAFPAIDPAGDGIEANNIGAQCFGINKNTKYPEEAFQWVVWMTTGRWDEGLAMESLGIPMGNDSQWPRQLAEAKAVVDGTTKRLPWAAGMEDSADINAKIKTNFARLISGSINAQQFADAMRR